MGGTRSLLMRRLRLGDTRGLRLPKHNPSRRWVLAQARASACVHLKISGVYSHSSQVSNLFCPLEQSAKYNGQRQYSTGNLQDPHAAMQILLRSQIVAIRINFTEMRTKATYARARAMRCASYTRVVPEIMINYILYANLKAHKNECLVVRAIKDGRYVA